MLRIAVLMPITAPVESTSGPPELPGLIAASVWMASITASASDSPASSRTGRSSALTMPWVTVPARPSGEPMAITASPTASPADDPIAATTGFAHVDLDDGEVGLRVAADDPRGGAGAVGEDRVQPAAGAGRGGGDDVVVGQHVAVALDDDPGARARLLADADLQGHDGGHGARGDVGHRARRAFLALRDRGQPGTGLGEPRGAVRRQPPDEPARGADEQREHPEDRQRPRLHPAAEQDLAQAQPGALTARRRSRGATHRRRRPELGGAGRVAPRVVRTGPERRIVRRGVRRRRSVAAAAWHRRLPGRPKASASAAGGGAVKVDPSGNAGAGPRPRRRRTPRPGARRPRRTRHRPRAVQRARAQAGSGAVRSRVRPGRCGTRGVSLSGPRPGVRRPHSLIETQPAAAAVKSA